MKKFVEFAREIEPMEWMRMATLLDTEGSIQIKLSKASVNQGCKRPNHQLQVTVTNTDPRIPLWCKAVFGGYVSFSQPPKAHHRKIYRWMGSTARGCSVLIGCLPYFLIKKNQAEIAIAYRDTIRNCGPLGHTKETWKTREVARVRLQELKREEFEPSAEHAEVVAQLDPRSTQR